MYQTHGFPINFDRHSLAFQRLLHRIRKMLLRFIQCERCHDENIALGIRLRQAGKTAAVPQPMKLTLKPGFLKVSVRAS